MNNKNLLQLIGGTLSFISFFMAWVSNGYSVITPSQLISSENESFIFKVLFLSLLFLSTLNVYFGFARKYNFLFAFFNAAICLGLIINVYFSVQTIDSLGFHTGYFLALVSMVALVSTFFVSNKTVSKEA